MIHIWELMLCEVFYTGLGFYLGNKVHPIVGFILMACGNVFAVWLGFYAIKNGLVIK